MKTFAEKVKHASTLPVWRGDYLRMKANILREIMKNDLDELNTDLCRPFYYDHDKQRFERMRNRLDSMIRLLHEASEFDVFMGKEKQNG